MNRSYFWLSLLILLLAGCGSTGRVGSSRPVPPPVVRPAPPPAPPPATTPPAPEPGRAQVSVYRPPVLPHSARPRTDRAVQALIDRAADRSAVGDLEGAAALLERALRIQPRNPRLWQRLAQVRYRQGRHTQAANLADRAAALAADDPAVRAAAERLARAARAAR